MKMMLATNGISQATERLAALTRRYPTFDQFMHPAADVFRQIDWPFYSRLLQPTNNAFGLHTNR